MLKHLAFICLIAIAPLGGCSMFGGSTSATTQAAPDTPRQQLVVAEYAFQAALRAIQVEVAAGHIKGEKARTVAKAVAAAKAALDVARTGVAQGKIDVTTILAATTAVANLVATYQTK